MGNEVEILAVLKRIESLLAICAKAAVEGELADERLHELYELTGEMTAADICKRLGMSKSTVSETWRRWAKKGIVQVSGRGYTKTV
jgi:predicted transcriptional regulator